MVTILSWPQCVTPCLQGSDLECAEYTLELISAQACLGQVSRIQKVFELENMVADLFIHASKNMERTIVLDQLQQSLWDYKPGTRWVSWGVGWWVEGGGGWSRLKPGEQFNIARDISHIVRSHKALKEQHWLVFHFQSLQNLAGVSVPL